MGKGRIGRRWAFVQSLGLTALALALVGCHDEATESSVGAGGAAEPSRAAEPSSVVDLDGFLLAEGQGFCARLFRCFEEDDDFASTRLLLGTPQACEAEVSRENARSSALRDLRAQIAAGAIHYEPQAGQACLRDLATCHGVDSLTQGICQEAFEGDVPSGGACQRNEDCQGDAYCNVASACPGQCAPRQAAGEPCQRNGDCEYATGVAYCDFYAEVPVCRALPKAPLAALGEPCTRRLVSTASFIACDDSSWCAIVAGGSSDDVMGECAAPIAGHGACVDSDDVCIEGLCDPTSGSCQTYIARRAAGESCDPEQLVYCNPLLGLSCNTQEQRCEASGDGTEGSACFTGDFQLGCDPGLYCRRPASSTSGVCTRLLPSGAACDEGPSCESGSCDSATLSCAERPCAR
jgi:hypothetical protein